MFELTLGLHIIVVCLSSAMPHWSIITYLTYKKPLALVMTFSSMFSCRSPADMICRTLPLGIPTKNPPYLLTGESFQHGTTVVLLRVAPLFCDPVPSSSACVQTPLYHYTVASRSDFFVFRTCSTNFLTALQLFSLPVIFSMTSVGLILPIQRQQLKKSMFGIV